MKILILFFTLFVTSSVAFPDDDDIPPEIPPELIGIPRDIQICPRIEGTRGGGCIPLNYHCATPYMCGLRTEFYCEEPPVHIPMRGYSTSEKCLEWADCNPPGGEAPPDCHPGTCARGITLCKNGTNIMPCCPGVPKTRQIMKCDKCFPGPGAGPPIEACEVLHSREKNCQDIGYTVPCPPPNEDRFCNPAQLPP